MNGRLILFPVPIGHHDIAHSLPQWNIELLKSCRRFIVEEVRTARRFIKSIGYEYTVDDEVFFVLNEHTVSRWTESELELEDWISNCPDGANVGLLSEAGLPCIADPGALAVDWALRKGITVKPLVGPSSLMLALMASGLNGQTFAFNGYLPIDSSQRTKRIKELERRMQNEGQTQIFIEAPYRNNQMLETLCKTCCADTKICVATDLTLETEHIATLTASEWKKLHTALNLHKRNTVFLIGK